MNKLILFAAIAVLALPAGITRAYDIWTNPPKASCNFTFQYNGDELPTANAYTNLGIYFVGADESVNTIKTNGNVKYLSCGGGYYAISNVPSWQPATIGPWTIEFRVRRVAATDPYIPTFDGQHRINHTVASNYFTIYTTKFASNMINNADGLFHTFRSASYSSANSISVRTNAVWRDGVFLGECNSASYPNPPEGLWLKILFGGTSQDFDYIRWTTNGAYPWKANPLAGTIISVY